MVKKTRCAVLVDYGAVACGKTARYVGRHNAALDDQTPSSDAYVCAEHRRCVVAPRPIVVAEVAS